eukprot:CAMPEP_0177675880 /NCGR_PEP_ID=MMETSP0447-20121125/27457_1 /TAXON_ID=0 /ORGANISM="Stygamoeba regulata, Strain BSH-02190019" /LENGTH=440 /DNA_ID=CAMNT_0019184337 /DNA_START=86 /DNA_END=1408 /DNA_ORIENTATION=+
MAQRGEIVLRIAAAGGSITAGVGVQKQQTYLQQLGNRLSEYLNAKVLTQNFGIPASSSYYYATATCGSKKLVDYQPHVIISEFQANDHLIDSVPDIQKEAVLESMVRDWLESSKVQPAVVFLRAWTPDETITEYAAFHRRVADQNGFLFVDAYDVVNNRLASRSLYTQGSVHPHPSGHKLLADWIYNAMVSQLERHAQFSLPLGSSCVGTQSSSRNQFSSLSAIKLPLKCGVLCWDPIPPAGNHIAPFQARQPHCQQMNLVQLASANETSRITLHGFSVGAFGKKTSLMADRVGGFVSLSVSDMSRVAVAFYNNDQSTAFEAEIRREGQIAPVCGPVWVSPTVRDDLAEGLVQVPEVGNHANSVAIISDAPGCRLLASERYNIILTAKVLPVHLIAVHGSIQCSTSTCKRHPNRMLDNCASCAAVGDFAYSPQKEKQSMA